MVTGIFLVKHVNRVCRQIRNCEITMASVFWDHNGVILVNYLPQVNNYRNKVLRDPKKIKKDFQNKRRGSVDKSYLPAA